MTGYLHLSVNLYSLYSSMKQIFLTKGIKFTVEVFEGFCIDNKTMALLVQILFLAIINDI